MLAGSCIWSAVSKYQNGTSKVARKAFNMGEVWNPVLLHGNGTVKLILWRTFSRILLQKIKNVWYKLAEISLFIIFEQNLVECMTSSLSRETTTWTFDAHVIRSCTCDTAVNFIEGLGEHNSLFPLRPVIKCLVANNLIEHFTVACSVTWPLNESDFGVDLALIETSLLLFC